MKENRYKILRTVSEQNNTVIYEGIRTSDSFPVIIKALKGKYPTQDKLLRLIYEYELLKDLNIEGVVKLYDVTEIENSTAIIEEYFKGKTLLKFIDWNLNDKLDIFIKTSEIIGNIHRTGIIHKDINPNNILVSHEGNDIRIIDFGLSVKIDKEEQEIKMPNVMEGTLDYLSPEQTGRMNRHLDFRTDYYSLGATFYKIFTGEDLFPEAKDSMEMVHFHIAKQPVLPHLINPEIPVFLSQIILKLLEKNAENRYQSNYGLLHDLKKVKENIKDFRNNNIEFELGLKDINTEFHIPQKLYGREKEKKELLESIENIKSGNREILFITGYSGVGKSALINEVHKSISKNNGYFITGKFDQYQKDIPYSAIISAFKELIKLVLGESESKLLKFKEKLLKSLGTNAKILVDVIPELEVFFEKQNDVQTLSPIESQNRFNFVFEKFIRVFATEEHPIILFLDDLQWVDLATLNLLKILLKDLKLKYFLLIGAYRDNEVFLSHPLNIAIESLKKEMKVINLTLSPLSKKQSNKMIFETLNNEDSESKELGELVFKKTGGNPFFTKEFLMTLYKEKLIEFDYNLMRWSWDNNKINEQNMSGNVVEFMLKNLSKLPSETQKILSLGACMGIRFNLSILAHISGKTVEDLASSLWPAVKEGFIIPIGDGHKILSGISSRNYSFSKELEEVDVIDKFLHDRVQQAAYELIPKEDIGQLHLKIGRVLWERYKKEKINDNIFLILEHLNKVTKLITEKEEKIELAKLNLKAAKRERESNAYTIAVTHSNMGIELLEENLWEENYELAYELFLENAESEYLSRNFESAEERFEELLKKSKTRDDRYSVYKIMIPYFISINKFHESIEIGIKALSEWGVKIPNQTDKTMIEKQYKLEMKKYSEFSKTTDISQTKKVTDREKEISMEFLEKMIDAAYLGNPVILNLIILTLVNLSIKHGNSESTPSGYVWWGVMLISDNKIEEGYRFGKVAIELVKNSGNYQIMCRTHHMFGGFIQFWKEHLSSSVTNLNIAFEFGNNSGDINYSNYAEAISGRYIFYQGKKLKEVKVQGDICLNFMEKTKHKGMSEFYNSMKYAVLSLTNEGNNPYLLNLDEKTEMEKLQEWHQKDLNLQISLYYILKLFLHYIYGDYKEAEKYIEKAKNYLLWITPQFDIVQFWFYSALVKLELYPKSSKDKQEQDMKYVNEIIEKLSFSSGFSEINFKNKLCILKAEKNRVLNNFSEAIQNYENAIILSKDNNFIHEEALANELYAKFWIKNSSKKLGKIFLTESLFRYKKWGAERKLLLMEKEHSNILGNNLYMQSFGCFDDGPNSFSSTTKQEVLDLGTIVKASQILSKEIKINKLLKRMMELVIENAGAQRGLFITKSDNQEFVLIEIDSVNNTINKEKRELSSYEDLLKSLVYYVINSEENLVIENASEETQYCLNDYVKTKNIKSVLCYPVMGKGKLVGLIYLENNMIPGVFTQNRVEVLNILSAQLAISLENAVFYENLENKVKERTLELFKKNELLELQNIELERLSTTDQLTRVYNRRYLENKLDDEINRCERYSQKLSLLILDIDNFKHVNDTYGHNIGDDVLVEVAETISNNIRKTDTLGRWGGEEFLVILPECENPFEAGEKIRKALENRKHELVGTVTVSIGVANYIKEDNKDFLVNRADKGLYLAKDSGRNRVVKTF